MKLKHFKPFYEQKIENSLDFHKIIFLKIKMVIRKITFLQKNKCQTYSYQRVCHVHSLILMSTEVKLY